MNAKELNLEGAAAAWEGTPFCERSAVLGAGVSCHRLAVVIYRDAGWLPELDVPDAPTGWSRAQTRSIMEEWLDGPGRAWFVSIPGPPFDLQPGDLLGFKLGHCVHHLAVHLTGGRVVSALEGIGVRIAPCIAPQWAKRLTRAWRPISP